MLSKYENTLLPAIRIAEPSLALPASLPCPFLHLPPWSRVYVCHSLWAMVWGHKAEGPSSTDQEEKHWGPLPGVLPSAKGKFSCSAETGQITGSLGGQGEPTPLF